MNRHINKPDDSGLIRKVSFTFLWTVISLTIITAVQAERLQAAATLELSADAAMIMAGRSFETLLRAPRPVAYAGSDVAEDPVDTYRQLLQKSADWNPVEQEVPNFGWSTSPRWLRTRILNGDDSLLNTTFQLDYALLDHVDLFLLEPNSGELLSLWQTGDTRNFATRPVQDPSFLFPITIQPGAMVDLVIRIQTEGVMIAPLRFWAPEQLLVDRHRFYGVHGIILGAILITSLYNLIVFLRTRESIFLWFSTFSVSLAMLFMVQSGLAFQLFWPGQPQLNQILIPVLIGLCGMFQVLFSRVFLATTGWADRVFQLFAATFAVMTVAILLVDYSTLLQLAMYAIIALCVVSLVIAGACRLEGHRTAGIYIIAWVFFLFGISSTALIRFELVQFSFFTEFAGIIGSLVTIVLLSLAIADRINLEKEHRLNAQQRSIRNLKAYQDLYNNSPEGLYEFSIPGGLRSANPAMLSMLGYNSIEALRQARKNDSSIFRYAHEREELFRQLLAEGSVVGRELEMLRADDSVFWASTTMRYRPADGSGRIFFEGSFSDITKRKHAERALRYLASHDPLTDTFNKREFERRLNQLLEGIRTRAAAPASSVAGDSNCLLYLDLDRFKTVNDSCGHKAGDTLLKQLTHLMKQEVGSQGTLARLGGDEFGVLLEDCTLDGGVTLAETLRLLVQGYRFNFEGRIYSVGVSIGIVYVQSSELAAEILLDRADSACYAAKDAGRNRIHVYSETSPEIARRRSDVQLLAAINAALETDSFELYVQKIVSSGDDPDYVSHEVLLRLPDFDSNEPISLLRPDRFLPTAQRYDLMPKIDCWVVTRAFILLGTNREWLGRQDYVSINLDSKTLGDSLAINYIAQAFDKHQIPYGSICFEITESTAIQNLHTTVNFISRFRKLGVRFALDDFGSGFSSYAYLKTLPVDLLKIDGAFARNVASDPVDFAMVRSITEVARAIGLKTVAEFVGDERSAQRLREIGVDYLQGFKVGRPEPLLPARFAINDFS